MRVMLINDDDAAALLHRVHLRGIELEAGAAGKVSPQAIRHASRELEKVVREWLREQGAIIE